MNAVLYYFPFSKLNYAYTMDKKEEKKVCFSDFTWNNLQRYFGVGVIVAKSTFCEHLPSFYLSILTFVLLLFFIFNACITSLLRSLNFSGV